MPIVPSVTTNGTIRSAPIAAPFTRPSAPPVAIAARMAANAGAPCDSDAAHTTLVSATAEPTDKSMPPLTMIIVMPSAPTAITAVWLPINTTLRHVKKYGRTSASSAKSASTNSRPSSGPPTATSWRTSNRRARGAPVAGTSLMPAPPGRISRRAFTRLVDRLTERSGHHVVLGPLADRSNRRHAAATHHADRVAYAHQLWQIRAHEHDRLAATRQFDDQPIDIGLRG